MNVHSLSSKSASIGAMISIFSQLQDSNYSLFLTGSSDLTDYYKALATNFSYPFPQFIGFTDEIADGKKFYKTSASEILRISGLLGRTIWEKTELLKIIYEGFTNAKTSAANYEKKIVNFFKSQYDYSSVALFLMNKDGGFSLISPFSEAVTSDRYFVTFPSPDNLNSCYSVTLVTIMEYFKKIILIVNSDEAYGQFSRIMEFESDVKKYPVLAFKNMENVEVLYHPN